MVQPMSAPVAADGGATGTVTDAAVTPGVEPVPTGDVSAPADVAPVDSPVPDAGPVTDPAPVDVPAEVPAPVADPTPTFNPPEDVPASDSTAVLDPVEVGDTPPADITQAEVDTLVILDGTENLEGADIAAAQWESDLLWHRENPNKPLVRAANPAVGGEGF